MLPATEDTHWGGLCWHHWGSTPTSGQGRSALSSCDCPFSPCQDGTVSLAPKTVRFWAQPPLRAEVGAGGTPWGPKPEGRSGPSPRCPGTGPGGTWLWPGVIRKHRTTPRGCWPLVRCGSDPERLEVESELLRGPCQARLDGRILMGPLVAAGSPCLLSAALRGRSPRRGLLDGPEGWWARVGPWFSSGPHVGMGTGC